jgi:hypothetical protein
MGGETQARPGRLSPEHANGHLSHPVSPLEGRRSFDLLLLLLWLGLGL